MSRTENSLRNIKVSLFFYFARIIVRFFARKVFVIVLTQEYLGLNGTFANILSMLDLAELGVGSALAYSLYRPLASGDQKQITALMGLFRKVYWVIGVVVALLGFSLAPFLSVLIRDLPDIPHIYLIYLLFVLNSSLSYFFVYKQALITADQCQYIVTSCNSLLDIFLHLGQALLLWLTGNYFLYLWLQIGVTVLRNLLLSYIADRRYPYIKTDHHGKLDPKVTKEIVRNTKGMLIHKIGSVVVFSTDNLLISKFVGIVEVGLYSNYLMITQALGSIYGQLFNSLTASLGNLGVTKDSDQVLTAFYRVNLAGNWLYGFSSVCLAVLLNPFIELWVGPDYLFSQGIVALIVLNFYVTGMRQAEITFCTAEGLFWYGRGKAIAESIINLVVSIALAVPYGIVGIFIGTFVSTMTTCFWYDPIMLFKYGLHASVKPYFRDYGVNTLVTLLTVVVIGYICTILPGKGLVLFIEKMAVCAVGGNAGFLLAYYRREEFHYFIGLARKLLKRQPIQ